MNIWYLHHYATPDSLPGLHRPFEFGKYFIEEGNNLTVFSSSYLHYSGENMILGNEKYKLVNYDGIQTVFIRTRGYSSSGIKRVMNMFDFYKRLKTNGKPDVIIASSPHPLTMMAGNELAKHFGVPCVCEIRDFWPEVFFQGGKIREKGLLGRILLRGEKSIYKKATALLFLKEGDHQYIKDHKWDMDSGGPIDMKKCFYVNNGVDISLFDKRKEDFPAKREKNGKFTVVYCGTIRPVNHVDILVDVGKLLGSDYQILVYGSGNCVESIQKRIKEEGVNNVFLKGYVDNKQVPGILSSSDLNILNYSAKDYNWSRGNSSNKLFEYLASSKPVLSTVKMGYDILERFECGVSTEDCKAELIAECIKKVKYLPSERYNSMCENARLASKQFDIPKLSRDYLNVLDLVLKSYKEK